MAAIRLVNNLYFMTEMEPVVGEKKVISPVIILAVVAVVIVALIVYASNKSTSEVALNDQLAPVADNTVAAAPVVIDTVPVEPTPVTDTQVVAYKDGTYTAQGDYTAPSGAESIKVTLTLKDNVVTASTVTASSASEYSERMQEMFMANYKTMVVGKKITDIKLGKVSGSSLTPIGFKMSCSPLVTP